MENKTPLLILLSISFLISHINAKTQTEVISSIYKFGKLKINKTKRGLTNSNLHKPEVYPAEEEGVKENDRIKRLPGQTRVVEFEQYGGYITVDRAAGRAFYYYFVESHNVTSSLPLLLWLNGGPGCSSLGYGAMEELGPFRVHSDGKTLYNNPFSWNHAANVLFVESPAGVGFSYSNTSADLDTNGDRRTAIDNHAFLLNWLERFPEYKKRDLYIAGESYGGFYAPQLAHAILNSNASTTSINLKGIIIGNGLINMETDMRGIYEFYGSHALVSDEITERMIRYCNFSPEATTEPDECIEATKQANHLAAFVDNYNIYAPTCFNTSLTPYPNEDSVLEKDPCSDYYVEAYLNRDEVQRALHANLTGIPYPWQHCSVHMAVNWEYESYTVLPLLKELMANGLRLWLYSGDVDGNVPVTSTKNSIKELKLPIKTSWRPWYSGNEVGGYTQVYKGDLTFATVRGAGHEVPSYQPARALSIINSFIAGVELPSFP